LAGLSRHIDDLADDAEAELCQILSRCKGSTTEHGSYSITNVSRDY
jgi:hypothetical protein